jgi:uncharacterized protein (TIGR02246 family)
MRACLFTGVAGAALAVVSGCQGPPPPDPQQAAAAIRTADAAWLAAAQAHDLERTVSYWSDDAQLLVPGAAPIVGKDAIRKYVSDAFAVRDFSISWNIDTVQVARAGDMAYAVGSNQIALTAPDGAHVVEHNKAVEVWRRDADGAWRCILDVASPGAAGAP